MVQDYSLKYLTTNSSVKNKIEVIKSWVENYGRIWGRRALYELVSKQLVKDTSDNTSNQNYKLWQNLREYGLIPYDWFRDKRTTIVNVGINDGYSFQERFDILCKHYTKSSKNLQNFYVEVWTEKELPDVTQELLKRYDIGLVMGEGFIGDIPFHDAIERIPTILDKIGIPIKIFYISDFDCEGEHTYQLCKEKLEPLGDIRIEKLFLTKEQVDKYGFISNVGYIERINKMTVRQKKAHLTKQYVQDFFKKYGVVQYELDTVPVDVLNEILENTISSIINLEVIEHTNMICKKEVDEWLKLHYKGGN